MPQVSRMEGALAQRAATLASWLGVAAIALFACTEPQAQPIEQAAQQRVPMVQSDNLAAAVTRAEAASLRLRSLPGGDARLRRQRQEIVRDLRAAFALASHPPRSEDGRSRLVARMDVLGEDAHELSDELVSRSIGEPVRGSDPGPRAWTHNRARAEFGSISDAAMSARDRLDAEQSAEVQLLTWAGVDFVEMLGDGAGRADDPGARRHLASLRSIVERLSVLHQMAVVEPAPRLDFLPSNHVPQEWIDCGVEGDGLVVARSKFVPPSSAHIVLANRTEVELPWFVELEFFDRDGVPTGFATAASSDRMTLRPNEVREIELQIESAGERFWSETRRYSAFVQSDSYVQDAGADR